MQGAQVAAEPKTALNAITTFAIKDRLVTTSKVTGKSMSAIVNEAIVMYFAHLGVPA